MAQCSRARLGPRHPLHHHCSPWPWPYLRCRGPQRRAASAKCLSSLVTFPDFAATDSSRLEAGSCAVRRRSLVMGPDFAATDSSTLVADCVVHRRRRHHHRRLKWVRRSSPLGTWLPLVPLLSWGSWPARAAGLASGCQVGSGATVLPTGLELPPQTPSPQSLLLRPRMTEWMGDAVRRRAPHLGTDVYYETRFSMVA